jgi:hypothetical protein
MPQIEIEVQNLDELKRALRDYPKIAEPIAQKAINATVAILAKNTTRAEVPWRTGRLLQSFIPRISRLQVRWTPTARYAIFVHEGTKAHVILPKNKKALFWEGARHPVKRVNHPGSKPNRFMERIAQKSAPEINKIFLQAYDAINKEVARRTNFK